MRRAAARYVQGAGRGLIRAQLSHIIKRTAEQKSVIAPGGAYGLKSAGEGECDGYVLRLCAYGRKSAGEGECDGYALRLRAPRLPLAASCVRCVRWARCTRALG